MTITCYTFTTTDGEWLFEPADRQVGIMYHAWIHEGCLVPDANDYVGIETRDRVTCPACGGTLYLD